MTIESAASPGIPPRRILDGDGRPAIAAARAAARGMSELLLIRAQERRQVAYFLLVFFFLGAGTAVGRGSADALFFKRYGIEHLPVMYAVLSVVLGGASLLYAAYADRLPSERLFRGLFGGLIVALSATWALMVFTDLGVSYPIYFLVYEVSSELLLLHAGLYLCQNFETLQAKRLTPLVFAGAQVGTAAGGLLLAGLASVAGVHNLLLVWIVLSGVALLLIVRHHRHKGLSPYYRPARRRKGLHSAVDQVVKGVYFARRSPLLLAASIALFFMVLAFYIMCYSVNRIYNNAFTSEAQLGAFFGILTAVTSVLALGTQLFVTGRLMRRAGVQTANLVFPVAGLATYVALLGSFALPAALLGSFAKDVLMPAIRRPVRQLFFSALPDNMQGRARALSVAFVLPLALAAAASVLIATRDSATWIFLAIGAAASLAYLAFNIRMNRLYRSAIVESLHEKVHIPSDRRGSGQALDPAVAAELERGIAHDDESIAIAYAKLIAEFFPERAGKAIAARIQKAASPKTQDSLLRIGMRVAPEALTACCRALLGSTDTKLRAAALRALFQGRVEDVRSLVHDCLESGNPRERAAGILGVRAYGLDGPRARADAAWRRLLTAPDRGSRLAGLELFRYQPDSDLYPAVVDCLEYADEPVAVAALSTLARWPERPLKELMPALGRLMNAGSFSVRRACVECAAVLPDNDADALCVRGLEDQHPDVQQVAVDLLDAGGVEGPDLMSSLILGNAVTPRAQVVLLDRLIRRYRTRAPFVEIADAKVADALALDEMAERAAAGKPGARQAALRVLAMALEERCHETVELALKAMQYTLEAGPIETIRAAFARGDRGDVARACEVLRTLGPQGLARQFNDLLERRRAQDDVGRRRSVPPAHVDEVLRWCASRPDPWLRECAQALHA